MPALDRRRVDRAALRGRLRLCRRRPARALPEGSDLALLAVLLHRPATATSGGSSAASRSTGSCILLAAPIALELLRQALGHRFGAAPPLLPARRPAARWLTSLVILLATVLCVAIPIKIWNSARIEHRLQEQEKLLMAARVEALASQINPHFLFNTLTSISSLIRSQPETARMLIVQAVRPAPPAAAQPGSLRHAARGARRRSTSTSTSRASASARSCASRRTSTRQPRRHRAEHDPAAAGRELDQARALAARSARAASRSAAARRDGHADHRRDRQRRRA